MRIFNYFCTKIKTKNKIKLLLIVSYLLGIGLFTIQFYLIKNTYILQKENFIEEIRNNINKIEVDKYEKENNETIHQVFLKIYINDSLKSKKAKLEKFYIAKDLINAKNTLLFQKKLDSLFPKYKIKYKQEIIEFVLQLNYEKDTLLKKTDSPMVIFGTQFETKNSFYFDYEITTINNEKNGSNSVIFTSRKHNIQLKSNSYIDISDWKWEVLKRMSTLLILSFAIILSVILLFYILYKKMLQQKKISEIKTDFANNITHELKTPLASLFLIVKSLEQKEIYNNQEKVKEMSEALKRQYERLQNVVDNVIGSSISNDEIELEAYNIKDFLQKYLENFNSNQHFLKTSILDNDVFINTNVSRLENVLNNLLDNAMKYSSANSEIEVFTTINEKFYIIGIKDSGIGISKENQKKIFDKFYRVSEINLHTTKGLGLGLYLCKQLVTKLGGNLKVKSELGKGSVFYIELPFIKE